MSRDSCFVRACPSLYYRQNRHPHGMAVGEKMQIVPLIGTWAVSRFSVSTYGNWSCCDRKIFSRPRSRVTFSTRGALVLAYGLLVRESSMREAHAASCVVLASRKGTDEEEDINDLFPPAVTASVEGVHGGTNLVASMVGSGAIHRAWICSSKACGAESLESSWAEEKFLPIGVGGSKTQHLPEALWAIVCGTRNENFPETL
jgi:hypothetical protein